MRRVAKGLPFLFCGGALHCGRSWGILIHIHGPFWTAGGMMTWTAPAFEEVCLNCEINSYASAKL
jgi:coenzyme PQQ precursor peptide PqqA